MRHISVGWARMSGIWGTATGLALLGGCGGDALQLPVNLSDGEGLVGGEGARTGTAALSGKESGEGEGSSPTPLPCPEADQLSDEFDAPCTMDAYASEQLEHVTADIDGRVDGKLVVTFDAGSPQSNGWYQNYRGPGFFKGVAGDFILRTEVRARSVASPDQPPTRAYNSAGLLVRDLASVTGDEDWVMYDLGFQNGVVGTESKTTQDSSSVLTIHPTADRYQGQLVICREGADLRMFRLLEGDSSWVQDDAFSRPDLPAQLEAGLIVNGWDSPPDIQAEFEFVRVEASPASGDCSVAGLNALYPAAVESGDGGTGGECPAAEGFSDEFDDPCSLSAWTADHLDAATIDVDARTPGHLTLTFDEGSPNYYGWYQDFAGPFLHKAVTGNFLAITRLTARHVDDSALPPSGQYNTAGILARDPASVPGDENWVVYNLGYQDSSVATEGKTTDGSVSVLTLLPTGGVYRGELAVCRFGSVFRMFRRLEGDSAWTLEHTYSRPDLPASLEVGLMANAWEAPPTIRAEYDYVWLSVPADESECSAASLDAQFP